MLKKLLYELHIWKIFIHLVKLLCSINIYRATYYVPGTIKDTVMTKQTRSSALSTVGKVDNTQKANKCVIKTLNENTYKMANWTL